MQLIRQTRAGFFFIAYFVILIGWISATNHGGVDYYGRVIANENYPLFISLVAIWIISIVTLIIGLTRPLWYRLFWAVIVALSAACSHMFYLASSTLPSQFDAITFLGTPRDTFRAANHYSSTLFESVLVLTTGVLILTYSPLRKSYTRGKIVARILFIFQLLPFFLILTICFLKPLRPTIGLPSQFTLLPVSVSAAYSFFTHDVVDRGSVAIDPTNAGLKNVILIVDESVGGTYLDFTSGNEFTPFIAAQNEDLFVNFGIASSASNCSNYTNAILRFTGEREHLTQSINTNPTIWQFAKHAGYKTYYLDGQSHALFNRNGRYINFMTVAETLYIDEIDQFESQVPDNVDMKIAEYLRTMVKTDTPKFIYVNKNGAHWPYDSSYPKTARKFTPVLFDEKRTGKSISEKFRMDAMMNSYRNAIKWSVDDFFKTLMDQHAFDDTVIIYTSDHGQRIAKNQATHCSISNSHPEEGSVPLISISGNSNVAQKFAKSAELNFNGYSHYQIVPTLVELMGYPKEWIVENLGSSLFEIPGNKQEFVSGDIMGFTTDKQLIWTELSHSK